MDSLFSRGGEGPDGGPDPTVSIDPILDRRLELQRWEIRAAQWRAWALAEAVFGREAQVHLTSKGGPKAFRGLLTLTVPFSDLPRHREREAIFMACAGQDPVLSTMPLIYVFQPSMVNSGPERQP